MGAASSGSPGWPLSAFCTMSTDRKRSVAMHCWSSWSGMVFLQRGGEPCSGTSLAQPECEPETGAASRLPAPTGVQPSFRTNPMATSSHDIVFLVDVDNTLLDNDRIV